MCCPFLFIVCEHDTLYIKNTYTLIYVFFDVHNILYSFLHYSYRTH